MGQTIGLTVATSNYKNSRVLHNNFVNKHICYRYNGYGIL